jgi:hypothetical protein
MAVHVRCAEKASIMKIDIGKLLSDHAHRLWDVPGEKPPKDVGFDRWWKFNVDDAGTLNVHVFDLNNEFLYSVPLDPYVTDVLITGHGDFHCHTYPGTPYRKEKTWITMWNNIMRQKRTLKS